jgi:hypothetical protein
MLTAEFSVEDVHEAIAQMEHNKAPGPDGFRINTSRKSLKLILWLYLLASKRNTLVVKI